MGLNTVMTRTRSKSASLLARKESPYSRIPATIIESLLALQAMKALWKGGLELQNGNRKESMSW